MDSELPPNDDNASEMSISSDVTSGTPTTYSTAVDDADGDFTGLSTGNTYMILERESLRAITITDNGLRLRSIEDGQLASNRWLCVEKNGWLGLQDPKSGRYLGHDMGGGMRATATELSDWECLTTRDRPGGVYQLLAPHWWKTLRTVVVAGDGESLITRQHGETLWRFLKTSASTA